MRVAVPARVVRVVGRVVVVLTVHGRAHGDVATHRDNHSLNTIVINRGVDKIFTILFMKVS